MTKFVFPFPNATIKEIKDGSNVIGYTIEPAGGGGSGAPNKIEITEGCLVSAAQYNHNKAGTASFLKNNWVCTNKDNQGFSGTINNGNCDVMLSKNCDSVTSLSAPNNVRTMINPTKTQFTLTNPPMPFIKITCNTETFRYTFTNSTAYFNPTKSQLEFTPLDNKDLGCQYNSGDNYLAFLCSADNLSADAVQYKCGL